MKKNAKNVIFLSRKFAHVVIFLYLCNVKQKRSEIYKSQIENKYENERKRSKGNSNGKGF
jgi:hypothetical protein